MSSSRRLYDCADRVLRRMQGLQDQLAGAIEKANDLALGALGDGATPLAAVLAVLNNNVDLLMSVDGRVDELTARLETVSTGGDE